MDALIPEDRLARAEKWSETLLVDGAPHQKEIATDVASLCKHVRDRDGGHLGSISGLQQTLAMVQARNAELEAETAELKAKNAELQINVGSAGTAEELAGVRTDLEDTEKRLETLRASATTLHTERDEAVDKARGLQEQLDAANAENAQLKQNLAKATEPKTGSQGSTASTSTGSTSGTEQTG